MIVWKCHFLIPFVIATIYARDVLLILGWAKKKTTAQLEFHTQSPKRIKPLEVKKTTIFTIWFINEFRERETNGVSVWSNYSYNRQTGTHVHNDDLCVFRNKMMMYSQDD